MYIYIHIYIHTYIYKYLYIYVYIRGWYAPAVGVLVEEGEGDDRVERPEHQDLQLVQGVAVRIRFCG